ncbi:MAG: hypothetical protein K6C14_00690 [Eubacterium sp.]|nr:hypothetical protein [Eubacterium sp.]
MKKYTVVILTLVITALAVSACAAKKPAEPENGTTGEAVTEAVTVTEKTVTEAVSETETETVTETVTEAPTVSDEEYAAIENGVWYLYDEDERTAYAFEFTGRDRVEISYFDSDNTDGLDAEYFSTSEDYEAKISDGETVIGLEDPINENESFEFTFKDGKIFFGKDELVNEKSVSLDTVFNHFNE